MISFENNYNQQKLRHSSKINKCLESIMTRMTGIKGDFFVTSVCDIINYRMVVSIWSQINYKFWLTNQIKGIEDNSSQRQTALLRTCRLLHKLENLNLYIYNKNWICRKAKIWDRSRMWWMIDLGGAGDGGQIWALSVFFCLRLYKAGRLGQFRFGWVQ